MKTVRVALLATALVVLFASPAAAAPVLAAKRFWFYWIAPILVLSALGIIARLVVGYYVRVLRPKYRGR